MYILSIIYLMCKGLIYMEKDTKSTPKSMSRRKFIAGVTGLVVLAGGGYALSRSALGRKLTQSTKHLARAAGIEADYLRQIITADSQSSRTIMWQSESPIDGIHVEYRKKGDSPDSLEKVMPQSEEFTDDGVTVNIYTAELAKLSPGTEYEYRIATDSLEGDWHPLTTEKGSVFKALIFPDSQSNDYSDWKNLAQNAAKRNPDAAFFTNLGDLVDNGEDHTQWNAWFDAVEGIIDRIPFAPVMGNHETYNQQWKVRLPEAYLHEFATPSNGSEKFGRYYYSFDYGPVHFMVLNTQADETEAFKSGLMEEQIPWLRKDMAKNTKKWSIVLLHRDLLQYRINGRPERKEGFSPEGEMLMPIFDELGIDIVFSAHLHTYRNRGHIKNFRHDSSGPLYILTGVAGNVRYPNLWIDHALDVGTAPQPETDNYLTMEVTDSAIDIRCFLPDGKEIDRAMVEK